MPQRKLRIAVVGCGSAGPAAAVLLKRAGHEVILFERAPECRAVGAGFLLQPSGMAVLEELGIREAVLERAGRVERLHVVDRREKTLLDLRYRELGEGMFGAGLHRPVLLHFLLEALREARVEVRWGAEVADIDRHDEKWTLRMVDGVRETGFDLLIIADGARSALRGKLGLKGSDCGYPWGAHWFIGENRGSFPEHDLHQIVRGTRRLAGFLATGREIGGTEPLVSLFWSVKLAEDASWRTKPLDEWKEHVLALCPRAETLLGQITDWSQILTARYGDVRMSRWHGEGVIVLGDAGHAMSPQLGQGVNLALADASCLARCMERLPLEEALACYTRERRWTLAYYRFATRQLTPWFQSDHEWLTPIRHVYFRTMQHLPPARRFMTKTMAGLVGR
ncbi:NAD(P)/FAD-dependent oxidoreductase [Luteolibacter sp. LG18]|uniref:FAD-dependent oxidoreductase n=1 Tax=Luteolibacter sp. LG18 TaxID=2819286 RepID=UPI0030C747BB